MLPAVTDRAGILHVEVVGLLVPAAGARRREGGAAAHTKAQTGPPFGRKHGRGSQGWWWWLVVAVDCGCWSW